MRRRLTQWIVTLTASASCVLASCACNLGSALTTTLSPTRYGAAPQSSQTVEAGGIAQQFDFGAHPVPEWWRLYRSDALDALVEEGLRNSPTLAATGHSLAAAREQWRAQVGSSTLPSLDASAQAAVERNLDVPGVGPNVVRYDVLIGQITAHYTFDLFGAVRYENAGLGARLHAKAFELEAARRALAANIVGSTIQAATLDRQIALTERSLALAREDARDDDRRYVLGAVTHAQALASRQSAASLAASLAPLRQQRAAAAYSLAVLIGRSPDSAPAIPDLVSLSLPERVPVVVPSELLRARPDIREADAAVKAAAATVGAATAQLYPSLSLVESIGRAGFSWPTALSGAGAIWSIGAGLSQPIFHGGALRAQQRAAIDSYQASVAQYKAVVLSAFQEVSDTLAALEYDADALEAAETASQAARTAFDEVEKRRRMGTVALAEERSSEQHYLHAQLDTVRAGSRRLSDTAVLLQAMGELRLGPIEPISRSKPQT
jgi:NodT family efflux transporter outer membrane factor (OMF) lipoprotein